MSSLTHLEEVASNVAQARKRQRGRPADEITRNTLSMLLVRAEQLIGEPVRRTATRQKADDPHLTGVAGEFVTSWFKLVDPTVTEKSLYHQVDAARAEAAADPKQHARTIKQLEVCELFAYAEV